MTAEPVLDHLRGLHSALDELLAGFLLEWFRTHPLTEVKGPSYTTVTELMEWNYARICRAEEDALAGREVKRT